MGEIETEDLARTGAAVTIVRRSFFNSMASSFLKSNNNTPKSACLPNSTPI